MATEIPDNGNVSIIMLNRIWDLLDTTVQEKSASADASIEAAVSRASSVDVRFDPGAANGAIAAVNGIDLPVLAPQTSPGSPAVVPSAPSGGPAPTPVSILVPSLGAIAPLGDYGAPPVLDSSGQYTLEGLRSLYENDRMEMLAALKASFVEFMDDYFPTGAYFEKATDWLERALDAQGTGIPMIVEEAMWERDRARLGKEAYRAEDEAMTTWSSRGYTLPPGALVHGVHMIRSGLSNALSQQSRDIAIKVTDVHIENAKFAVQQAVAVRAQAMSSAIEYIKALMVSPQYVGQWLGALLDGQAKMAGAQADIFRTRANVATDVYKVGAQTELEKYKTGADVSLETAKTQNSTALESYRVGSEADRQIFLAQVERYRTSEQFRLQQFQTTEDVLIRHFEAEARAASIKGDLLTKSGELAVRIGEDEMRAELESVKMQVDAVMEKAKMIATQAAAALNNLQLSASTSNSSSTTGRM